jgi:hypothetical protein
MKWRKYIYFSFLLLACSRLAAQSLQGLQENQVIKKQLIEHPFSLKSATDGPLLSLPFFEDFSTISIFPDPVKWVDKYAFINSSFAIDPISIGVATMDAIDENGDVYAITNSPTSSDKLTSQVFDLSTYTFPDDTVSLSFFYQCGGNGEVPELNDSLLLEFYSPVTKLWKVGWYATLNSATDFQQVILEVDSLYYKSGFQFRFRNYTSISADDVNGGEGALSNADCWNIDYIMMNINPVSTHRSINDVTIIDPPRNLMDFYEIIPWLHLNEAQSITRNYMHFDIRNLSLNQNDSLNVGRSYYLKDINTGNIEFYDEYFTKFEPDTVIRRNDPFFAPFTRNNDSEEGLFEVGSYLITPGGQYKQNDTAKIMLNFKDSYAYDDGTPEYGFGIAGPSMAGALLALRFRIFKSDTLQAIDMLFNKTRNNFNADLGFHLCVWKDGSGIPGDLIFMSPEVYFPGSESAMPGFRRYAINADEDIIVTDTVIYVGWKQVTDDFLNLGYDVNRNNLDRTFVNVSGDWFNPGASIIPGTIMMRAVFGNKKVISGIGEMPETPSDVILYPNPVSGILTMEPNGTTIKRVSIVDLSGRLVIRQDGTHNTIDVSGLSPGIYQVLLTTGKEQQINRKIVVSH